MTRTPDAPEPDTADSSSSGEAPPPSDLEDGLHHLGRAFGGVLTRLLGPRVTGQPLDPEKPVLGPEADRVVGEVGDTMGRWLHAAGTSLKDHPTRPGKVIDQTVRHAADDVSTREGETVLTEGLRSFAGGMYKATEAVLDKVAPRKPKTDGSGPKGDDEGA